MVVNSPPRVFEAHLKACGTRHELTVPKTPEQNGAAEGLNCTLVEMTRAMLLDAKLHQKFWAEAIPTAAYLRNRSPTSAVACPEICIAPRTPIYFYYRLIRLAPISIYKLMQATYKLIAAIITVVMGDF